MVFRHSMNVECWEAGRPRGGGDTQTLPAAIEFVLTFGDMLTLFCACLCPAHAWVTWWNFYHIVFDIKADPGAEDLLPAAKKLGQGNVFTGVCHSVNGGGSASVHAGISTHTPHLGPDTPRDQTPPRSRTPVADPPPRVHTPPGPDPPQPAAGTHPTGMHSCFSKDFARW